MSSVSCSFAKGTQVKKYRWECPSCHSRYFDEPITLGLRGGQLVRIPPVCEKCFETCRGGHGFGYVPGVPTPKNGVICNICGDPRRKFNLIRYLLPPDDPTFGLTTTGSAVTSVTDTAGGSVDTSINGAGGARAVKVTVTATGMIITIGRNCGATVAGTIRVAIYTHNATLDKPANLVAQSASVTTIANWNDLAVAGPVVSGIYWLAYQVSSNVTQLYYGNSGRKSTYALAYGVFEAVWSTGSTQTDNYIIGNMRVIYSRIYGGCSATKAICVDSGQCESISFYSHGVGNVRLALYSDSAGAPSGLLWESPSTACAAAAWTTIGFNSGTPSSYYVVSGTYHLAYQWSVLTLGPSYTAGSAGDGNIIAQVYGAFPASWVGGTTTPEKWSLYVSYILGGQLAEAPIPTSAPYHMRFSNPRFEAYTAKYCFTKIISYEVRAGGSGSMGSFRIVVPDAIGLLKNGRVSRGDRVELRLKQGPIERNYTGIIHTLNRARNPSQRFPVLVIDGMGYGVFAARRNKPIDYTARLNFDIIMSDTDGLKLAVPEVEFLNYVRSPGGSNITTSAKRRSVLSVLQELRTRAGTVTEAWAGWFCHGEHPLETRENYHYRQQTLMPAPVTITEDECLGFEEISTDRFLVNQTEVEYGSAGLTEIRNDAESQAARGIFYDYNYTPFISLAAEAQIWGDRSNYRTKNVLEAVSLKIVMNLAFESGQVLRFYGRTLDQLFETGMVMHQGDERSAWTTIEAGTTSGREEIYCGGTGEDSWDFTANYEGAFKIDLPTGLITRVLLKLAGPVNVKLALYDDDGGAGEPATKLIDWGTFACVTGVNVLTVAPYKVNAGVFWLGYLPDNAQLRYASGGPPDRYKARLYADGLENPWPNATDTHANLNPYAQIGLVV